MFPPNRRKDVTLAKNISSELGYLETRENISQQSVTTFNNLKKHLICDNNALEGIIANFQMGICSYFLLLTQKRVIPCGFKLLQALRKCMTRLA